jgi:hypothetical protein
VPNPVVAAVPDDAGTLGHMFGQSQGIDAFGYEGHEFFFTGTSPAYTTRLVVHRPTDAARFTGTVFVEWYNVSGGIDFAPSWALDREYFMREGHVHIGVSAQSVGANRLKTIDAVRYADIQHPGDTAADAIFSQAGKAIRSQTELLLGPGAEVRALLASGQSQSAMRLTTYVNSVQATARIYDGFLLHSGFVEPARNDPEAPVLAVFTMHEGNGTLAEGPNFIKWHVAGATHNDANLMARGNEVSGDLGIGDIQCSKPVNDFPSWRAYNAANDWLHRWVRDGERPPSGIPFETAPGGGLRVDAHGNVLGGLRLPDIAAPIATHALANGPANPFDIIANLACGLGGSVVDFTEGQLLELYPTHEDYVREYTEAADRALADGHLLRADYDAAIAAANAAPIPN